MGTIKTLALPLLFLGKLMLDKIKIYSSKRTEIRKCSGLKL